MTRIRLMTGPGIDPTGATDSSAAIQAKLDALSSAGGDAYFPPGTYRADGLSVTKPVTFRGAGHHGAALTDIPTRIVTNSGTASLFTLNAAGVSFCDMAIVNDKTGAAPTAGVGVKATSAYFLNMTRCSVIGFYDNVTIDNAWLYNFTDCHFHDAVHDYVRIGNSVNSDVGGGVVQGCSFTPAFYARVARAFLRWEAAGGLRFIANKMNGDNNLDPLNIVSSPPTNGLDIAVGDGVSTIDMLIASNSIERMGNAAIRVVLAGPNNTGLLRYVMIQNNQTLGGDYAVIVNPAVAARISDVIIDGNVFYSYNVAGVQINNVSRAVIGPNIHDNAGSSTPVPVILNSGATNVDLYPQKVNGDGIPILTNHTEDTAGAAGGMMDHRYQRAISAVTSNSAYTTLWRFTAVNNRGGTIRVRLSGLVAGVGPFSYFAEYAWIANSGVTLTAIGSVVTAGAVIDVSLDVAAVSGEIQVKVRRNSGGGGTSVDGRCEVELTGAVGAVRKGA